MPDEDKAAVTTVDLKRALSPNEVQAIAPVAADIVVVVEEEEDPTDITTTHEHIQLQKKIKTTSLPPPSSADGNNNQQQQQQQQQQKEQQLSPIYPLLLNHHHATHESTLVFIQPQEGEEEKVKADKHPPKQQQQQPGSPSNLLPEIISPPSSTKKKNKASTTLPRLQNIIFGTASAKGARPYMEDRHIIIPEYSLSKEDPIQRSFAGVYDGHNGLLAADYAAECLHNYLAADGEFIKCTGVGKEGEQEEDRVAEALTKTFEVVDKGILDKCRELGQRGGATAVVTLRLGDWLYAAHAGDSRAVLCRAGEALRLTEDHKPNVPRERKRVEGIGGRVEFARCWRVIVTPGYGRPASGLAVSRSFGDPDFKEPLEFVTATPDVIREKLVPEDSFLIMASDGLWDVITDEQACDIVMSHLSNYNGVIVAGGDGNAINDDNKVLDAGDVAAAAAAAAMRWSRDDYELQAGMAASALVEAALSAGTMDNVTAVVGLLHWIEEDGDGEE
jgi:serine/threonine protein phosphatase PrpC